MAYIGTSTHFAHNLTLLRNFFGYASPFVAEKLKVDTERYRHWEKGKFYPSHPSFYVEVCKLYGFTAMLDLFTKKMTDEDLHHFYNALEL